MVWEHGTEKRKKAGARWRIGERKGLPYITSFVPIYSLKCDLAIVLFAVYMVFFAYFW